MFRRIFFLNYLVDHNATEWSICGAAEVASDREHGESAINRQSNLSVERSFKVSRLVLIIEVTPSIPCQVL